METNSRPYVICHMVTSIDGKVTGQFLSSDAAKAAEEEYRINRKLKGEAFACGRITMEGSFTRGYRPDLSAFEGAELPEGDFIARQHGYYAVSFDRKALVGWTDSLIHDEDEGYDDCHIIEVLTEEAPKAALAYYRSIGVSYIFAGEHDIDICAALRKLRELFGIRTLLLEGGSIINGAFARAGAVDELSLVAAPVIADADSKPLFYDCGMSRFDLELAEPLPGGAVWLRYKAQD